MFTVKRQWKCIEKLAFWVKIQFLDCNSFTSTSLYPLWITTVIIAGISMLLCRKINTKVQGKAVNFTFKNTLFLLRRETILLATIIGRIDNFMIVIWWQGEKLAGWEICSKGFLKRQLVSATKLQVLPAISVAKDM